jgi:secreted PhoX family phosphatase
MSGNIGLLSRRALLRGGVLGLGGIAFGSAFWRDALAATPAAPGTGPYGELVGPDVNGLMLPPGFASRLVARAGEPVAGTSYAFPVLPDGQTTFPTPDGGWILVTNSEARRTGEGGASAIRFRPDGSIGSAARILGGTTWNCAGGRTPWGTWMSCEEVEDGRVWECDPTGAQPAVARPAMGRFKHEALAVDPLGQRLYLSEDEPRDAGLYRFTPSVYPDCSAGLLEIAEVGQDGTVSWLAVPDPLAMGDEPTRDQVTGATSFNRGEGLWFDSGIVYLVASGEQRIHAYDTRTGRIEVVYDVKAAPDGPLRYVDGIGASPSGDLYLAEDDDGSRGTDIAILTPERTVAPFARLAAAHFTGSDVGGICFDPSGARMYLSAQRAYGMGAVYEVSGRFRPGRAAPGQPAGGAAPPATSRRR